MVDTESGDIATLNHQIENTPEVKKKKKNVASSTEEESPCLVLAPFTPAPKVIFENIPLGTVAERNLDIVNPTTKTLQIMLGKAPPPGLTVLLPADHITLEPHNTYCVTLRWIPAKPVAQRETIHFTDEHRGRYDVVVILKAVILAKKPVKTKVIRKSPTKLVVKKIGVRASPKRLNEMSPKVKPCTPRLVKAMEKKSIKANIASYRQEELHNFIDIRVPKNKPMRPSVSTQFYQETNSAHFVDMSLPLNKVQNESFNIQDKNSTYNFNLNETVDIKHDYKHKEYYKDNNKSALTSRNMLSPPNVLTEIDNCNFTPLKSFKTTPRKSYRSEKENIYCGHQNVNNQPAYNYDQPYSILTDYHQNNVKNRLSVSPNVDDIFQDVNFTPLKGETFTDRFAVASESEDIRRDTYAIRRSNKGLPLSYENSPDSLEGAKRGGALNNTHPIINISDSKGDNDSIQFDQANMLKINSNKSAINITVDRGKAAIDVRSPIVSYDKTPPRAYHNPCIVTVNNVSCPHLNETDISFNPHQCSTEMKNSSKENCTNVSNHICKGLFNNEHRGTETPDVAVNKTFLQISSETYTKGDSPIIPLDPNNPDNLQSSPYTQEHEKSPKASYKYNVDHSKPRSLSFTESSNVLNQPRRVPKNRNCADAIRNIIEADMWQNQNFPPNSTSPAWLSCIPEESSQLSESNTHNITKKHSTSFAINRTYEKTKIHKETSSKKTWSRSSVKVQSDLWKIPESYIKTEVPKKKQFEENTTHDFSSNSMALGSHTDYLIGNVYSMSSTIDPFLAQTYFYDERAVDQFEEDFKKWLNCLLTPPAEFETNTEAKVDVGKVWIETRYKEVPLAPTREQVSLRYHNSHRLDSLRKSAQALLTNPKMIGVFGKLASQIDRKVISVRGDKILHLDVGLQRIIMDLLLCYNPLWLRIGLEALYSAIIPLSSNSDVYGLTAFIIQRMFKDPNAKTKYSHHSTPNMLMPAYIEYMNKFTLKKYFMLVYFLDQAKEQKLIPHDPCLFCRNAQYKESREMLIRFTREMIAGIGDITKHLRPLGYVVSHKQSFLDEFKFAVHNLAIDLKDGVRLTKAMEIILLKKNLTKGLRTPPVSRMQKIHNVELAFNALKASEFKIVGNIEARDIVDGHREKTLSLLWQIIHVFRAPLFEKAAIRIQTWWKKKYLIVWAQRRVEEKILRKRNNAAYVIQIWWRKILYQRIVVKKMAELVTATIVIQKYWRMWMYNSIYKNYKNAAIIVQKWYRSRKLINNAKAVLKQLQLRRDSLLKIESWYKRQLNIKRILHIRDLYINYCKDMQKRLKAITLIRISLKSYIIRKKFINVVKCALQKERARILKINIMATKIQNCFRKWHARTRYLSVRRCVINIQRYARGMLIRQHIQKWKWATAYVQTIYKGKLLMRKKTTEFQNMKTSAINIQSFYRMYVARKHYKMLKNAVLLVEHQYLANRAMKLQRVQYVTIRTNVIRIQSHVRSYLNQKHYEALRTSTILIQRKYRANCMAKLLRKQYLEKRKTVIAIQSYVRRNIAKKNFMLLKKASIAIQTRYKALTAMRKCQADYRELLKATRFIQAKFRANIIMVNQRKAYKEKRSACVFIQSLYRANVAMNNERSRYQLVRKACITIQSKYRAKKCKDLHRNNYLELRNACIFIQIRYRANVLTKQSVKEYTLIRNSCILIQSLVRRNIAMKKLDTSKKAAVVLQSRYRAQVVSRKCRSEYLKLLETVRLIQAKFRANRIMKIQFEYFQKRRAACLYIQRLYRANVARNEQRSQYERLRKACLCIQIRFRANRLSKECRDKYRQLQNTCVFVQNKYRAILLTRRCVLEYTTLRKACIVIQCQYRALVKMRKKRKQYRMLYTSTICLQARYRALLAMRVVKNVYLEKRNACILIQRTYKSYKLRLLRKREREHAEFVRRETACRKIQTWYRATQKMHIQRNYYRTVWKATIFLQIKYKAMISMKKERTSYLHFLEAVRLIQARFRGQKEMVKCHYAFTDRKQKTLTIQKWYRAIKLGAAQRNYYKTLRKSAIVLQRRYRAKVKMCNARTMFIHKRVAAIRIQQWYRSVKLMLVYQKQYIALRQATIRIQSTYRMYCEQKYYRKLRITTIFVQHLYRLHKAGEIERKKYLKIKMSAIKIQATVRAFLQRKLYLKLQKVRRLLAVLCIQKNWRAFLARRRFCRIVKSVILIQTKWRAKRKARVDRLDFVEKKVSIIKLQASIRAYLARKHYSLLKEDLKREREERTRNNAALKIQSIWRGYRERKRGEKWTDVVKLRRRWQQGALQSTQETLAERNEDALEVLCHFSDIASVIRAFISLELLTSVFPMIYEVDRRAKGVSAKLIMYMSVTNRSISSLETLRLGASILVNMARYRPTAVLIYDLAEVSPILKLMMRWCDKDGHLFRVLCTYLWLFGKYPAICKELKTILRTGDNNKMLTRIRASVMRKKRMDDNSCKNKQQQFLHNNSMNTSLLNHSHSRHNSSLISRPGVHNHILMPLLEPDFGLMRDDRPRFFERETHAIDAIFMKFSLPMI